MTIGSVILLTLAGIILAGLLVMLAGHDTPNAVALAVRSRALTPQVALLVTAGMRVVGVFLGVTVIKQTTHALAHLFPSGALGLTALMVAMLSSLGWGIFTWRRGIPASTSHSFTAGLIGVALALNITDATEIDPSRISTGAWILLGSLMASPVIAGVLAWLLGFPVLWMVRDAQPGNVNTFSRMVLAVATATSAVGHGAMHGAFGYTVMLAAFALAGIPLASAWWVPVLIAIFLAGGTFLGGWKIGFTLTERLTTVDPLRSAIASMTSALLLLTGSLGLNAPVSSSLTTTGSIVGAGHQQAHNSVRWIHVGRVAVYFVLTVLLCALVPFVVVAVMSVMSVMFDSSA